MPDAPHLQRVTAKFADKGDNVIIEGVADQHIDVYQIALTCESKVNLQLLDGSENMGFYYNREELFLGPILLAPCFELGEENPFVINLPDSIACQGTVWYTQA